MLDALGWIKDTVAAFGQLVLWGVVTAFNGLIAAVGALLGLVMSLLPNLPPVPGNPVAEATGWIAFFIPAGPIVAFAALLITAYVALLVIRIALRWVKAL